MRKKETFMMLAVAGILTVGGVGIGQTYSYFTQKESVNNVFTVGNLEIGLKEPEWNPEGGDGKNIYPGYSVYKDPTVKNIKDGGKSTQPCYLLMRVKVLDEKGQQITDPDRLALIRKTIRYDKTYTGSFTEKGKASGLTEGKIPGFTLSDLEKYPMINPQFDELDGSAGEWVFGYKGSGDGILKENEEKILFTNIVIPTEWTSAELDIIGNYSLEISAEAIQSNGFASRTEAFAALQKK